MKTFRIGPLPAILLALSLTLVADPSVLKRPSRAAIARPSPRPQGSETVSSLARTAPVAIQPQPRFERITTADGLSFPIVRDILQDRQGFLWFATDSGLNRYDGYAFVVYKEDPGDSTTIRFDDVRVLLEDSDGTLWAGGGGGLDRFDRATGTFIHMDTRGQVFSLYEDSTGTLWAGFWHGLYGYDRTTNAIIYSDQPNPDAPADWAARTESSVTTIAEDPSGELWIGTVAGLYRLDRTRSVFTAYRHDPQDPASVSGNAITALYADQQGTLWVGTDQGLDQLDPASGAFRHYRHDPEDPYSLSDGAILSILEDRAGTLWLGTMSGLEQFNPGQRRFQHYQHDPDDLASLSGTVVTSLLEDDAGLLWVGTANGVSKSNRREDQFTHYQKQLDGPTAPTYTLDVSGLLQEDQPAILSDGTVFALHEDRNGVLWIGTANGGLNRLDRQSGRLTVFRHDPANPTSLNSDSIPAVFEDHAGVLWVGTEDGWLERLDPQTETFIHDRQLGAALSALAEGPAGNLWVGTAGDGLYRLGPDRLVLEHFPQFWQDPDHWWREGTLSSHVVSTLQVDQAGTLWAGTVYGGINLWGVVPDRFTHHRREPGDPESLSHDQVLSILDDPARGVVWIGTGGGGLNRYERATGTFARYTAQDGLPGDTVGCILADEAGFLWLATVQGLSRFDPAAGTFRNYDRRDGIGLLTAGAAAPGSCLRSRTGELFFGGADGLYAFRPEGVKQNLYAPPLAITAVKIFNETAYENLAADTHIQLRYQDNFLSFEFAALDYTMPEKNQYAYRLEGLDRDWVYAGTRRYANYPNLRPGDYVFQVRGSNSDGVWNEAGIAVRITLEPPFHQTWAFRILVAGMLLLGTIGVYRQRVRGIAARGRELERQVEERTQEVKRLSEKARELAVMEERQRLARDLHDAVSQTLFSASLIAEALPELWKSSPAEGHALLGTLQQLNRGALAEMRALLMELRPAALAEASMRDLLRQLGQAASGREGIPVQVTVDEDCDTQLDALPADARVALYRIAQEALNNVVKHAQASRVKVGLRCVPAAGTTDDGRLTTDGVLQTEGTEAVRFTAELCVRDDGRGFDPNDVPPDRLGLGIMRERAEAIGARFEVESAPGEGTRVSVVWPADDGRQEERNAVQV